MNKAYSLPILAILLITSKTGLYGYSKHNTLTDPESQFLVEVDPEELRNLTWIEDNQPGSFPHYVLEKNKRPLMTVALNDEPMPSISPNIYPGRATQQRPDHFLEVGPDERMYMAPRPIAHLQEPVAMESVTIALPEYPELAAEETTEPVSSKNKKSRDFKAFFTAASHPDYQA